MHPKLRRAARIMKQVVSALAVLLLLLVVGASIAAYLAVTGKSLTMLRFASARLGQLVAGQRTQHLTLEVQLTPAEAHLAATATLVVQSVQAARQRFYFLLNDGLRLRRAQVEGIDRTAHPASIYQLWLLTVVDVGAPVPKDGTVKLTLDYDGTPAPGMLDLAATVLSPQRIRLGTDSLWYPSDVQGFFNAEVTASLPASMTVVHNGVNAARYPRGDLQQVHWSSAQPIAGLAFVAGEFALATKEVDGITYRLYLPADVQLDTARVLDLMSDANSILQQRYGPSGLPQVTLFVDRGLRHATNDGSGLMGLSIHHFRAGDYGFSTIAQAVAHDWWGGMVATDWLSPGTGGAWIVESLSEFSSLIATEAKYGAEALHRRRNEALFDPSRPNEIEPMSGLDFAAEPLTRDAIYRKGAYAALMLRQTLGDDACFSGLRQFLHRFKFQQATDRNLQQVLQETSQQNLERFFTDWLRSDRRLDLSLDGNGQTAITVGNLGSAAVPGDIDLWTFKKADAAEPSRTSVHLGDRIALTEEVDHVVLDPLLLWADVQRHNNRYPRQLAPVHVATSSRGDLVITHGDIFPWERAAVVHRGPDDRTLHTWNFTRGMVEPASWFPDGSRIVVSYSEAPGALPAIVTLTVEGTQRTIGYGTSPMPANDGAIYAGRQDRIVRFDPAGRESSVVRRRGETLDHPVPSPDGTRLVYSAARGNALQLRAVNRDGGNDRQLLSWDRDRMLYRWAADGTRLYVVVGGNWDWQIWEVPLDSGPVAALAAGAAAIFDLALSPDGSQVGFTAAPDLDYPSSRGRLYVLRLRDRSVRGVDLPDADLGQFTWVNADSVVAVATAAGADQRWVLPATRGLKRIKVSDGSAEDLP